MVVLESWHLETAKEDVEEGDNLLLKVMVLI